MSPFQSFLTTLTVMNICRLEKIEECEACILNSKLDLGHFHSDPHKFWKFWNGVKLYRNVLGKSPENTELLNFWKVNHSTENSGNSNEVRILGKSSFLENYSGKCYSIHHWKFPEIQTPHLLSSLFMALFID